MGGVLTLKGCVLYVTKFSLPPPFSEGCLNNDPDLLLWLFPLSSRP